MGKILKALRSSAPRIGLLAFVSLLTATHESSAQQVVSPADLTGTWRGYGYYCVDAAGQPKQIPVETVVISAEQNVLMATKVAGDDCVRAGEITWRGVLRGNQIVGEGQTGLPNGTRGWVPATIRVIDRNTLEWRPGSPVVVEFRRMQ